jgi:UDP-N-acetylglucosamine--N-acetylmuramyl-(pentapeptide) pyrophosphoryl-undecaprenol N-acetylglucosamine transferase
MSHKQSPSYWICCAAGKSGGHTLPALTLAHQRKRDDPRVRIIFFSTDASLDTTIVGASPIIDKLCALPIGNLPAGRWYLYPILALKLFGSLWHAFFKLLRYRPREIITTGGYVALPVCLAGWLLRIPITLYELNAVPGKAVRFLSRFAQRICVCFDVVRPLLPADKVVPVAYPLRFTSEDIREVKAAREQLEITSRDRVLLVLGGSQGSRFLNDFVQEYIRSRALTVYGGSHGLTVVHQVGERNVERLKSFYNDMGVRAFVFSYKPDIALYYAAADAVIARAGAGTLFELAFFGKKALIIPLETASTCHQLDNAYALAARRSDLFTVSRQVEVNSSPENAYRYLDSMLIG